MAKISYDFANTTDAEQAYNGVFVIASYDEESNSVSPEGTSSRLLRVDSPFSPVVVYERGGENGEYQLVASDVLLNSIVQTYPCRQFVNALGTCYRLALCSRRQYRKALPVSTTVVDMATDSLVRISSVIAAEAFLGGSRIASLAQFMASGHDAAHISGTSIVLVRRGMTIHWMGEPVGNFSNGEVRFRDGVVEPIRVKVSNEMQRVTEVGAS